MNEYIIAPPKFASAKYALYQKTNNPLYPKPVAFSNRLDGTNVQGLLELIMRVENFGSFRLEVKVNALGHTA